MTEIARLARWLSETCRAVAFTGAGISTESGIPDFRSPGGVWARTNPVLFDDFLRYPESRLEYWRQKAESHADFVAAEPNIAHQSLAAWESAGLLRGVITQNIDGLHQLAGSRSVLELHGTAREIACLDCECRYEADVLVRRFLEEQLVPNCHACGGMLKHATISFGQPLKADVLRSALAWSREADLFLVVGSSLVVEPAASLPRLAAAHGARLVIINREPTPLDSAADLVLHAEIREIFSALPQRLSNRHQPGGDA